jgi:hypothetical protein
MSPVKWSTGADDGSRAPITTFSVLSMLPPP